MVAGPGSQRGYYWVAWVAVVEVVLEEAGPVVAAVLAAVAPRGDGNEF